jgi:beta-N-acetylglucosaminidase
MTSFAYTERSATINASSLNVRSGAGTGYSSVAKLASGTLITVTNEVKGSDNRTWYQIRFTGTGGASMTGYVLGTYVRFPVSYSTDSSFEAQLSAQGFPESYKDGLRQLHAQFPNWVFEAQKTGLDWNTVVENEMVLPRSLVDKNSISSYKSLQDGAYNWDTSSWVGFDGDTWVAASQELLSYYMDPRNQLDQVSIFQFLSHTYDSSLQTKEGLQEMIKGTFLENAVITNGSGSTSTTSTSSGSGSSGTISSGTVSGGPGVSSSSKSNTITAGSGSAAAGSSSGSSGSTSGSSGSSSGGSVTVELRSPSASISKKDAPLLTETVIVGAKPGDDTSGSGSSSSTGSTSGSSSSGSSVVITSPGSSSSSGSSTVISSGSSGSSVTTTTTQSSKTYADMIMEAAQTSGVNPYVLAAMILQEQGKKGTGRSISGTVSGYSGYYNYFNVGAYASDGLSAVERGLWYASQSGSYGRPWNTPEKSISGGAQFYGENYVKAGQDTFYLKKFNVQGSNIYKHQYMTNVDGAAAEASLFAEGYTDHLKNTALRFKIPVYNNMPETACAKPTGDGSPNNKLKSLTVDGFTMTPSFSRDTTEYQVIVDQSVTNVNVNASVIDSKAGISGTGNVQVLNTSNEITVRVTAQNGSIRDYKITVVKQNGGPTYNGMISSGGTGNGISVGNTTTSAGSSPVITVGPGVSSGSTTSGTTSGTSTGISSGSSAPTPGGSSVTIIN